MILTQIGMIAVDSARARAYLAALRRRDLLPGHFILLQGAQNNSSVNLPPVPYFDNTIPALETIRSLNLPYQVLPTTDINSPEVVQAVRVCPAEILIYSGVGGAVLRREILNTGKRFLHVHPGIVPRYRGSTTVYYNLLIENNCGASALFLNEQIDTGAILAMQTYPPPADRTTIDHGYDPYIRSDLLARVLTEYAGKGEFHTQPQSRECGETYYIMHPVLRHIAILSRREATAE